MPTKQVLIVVPPGRLQEGLQVLLATLAETGVVVVSNTVAATAQVALRQPQLVIVAGDGVGETVGALRCACPSARFLALVEDAQQRRLVKAAGADAVVVEGIPAGRLLGVVRSLLAESSAERTEVK